MNCSVEYCVALEDDALLSDSLQDMLLSEKRRTQDSVCSSLAPVCGHGLCLDSLGLGCGVSVISLQRRSGERSSRGGGIKNGFFFQILK